MQWPSCVNSAAGKPHFQFSLQWAQHAANIISHLAALQTFFCVFRGKEKSTNIYKKALWQAPLCLWSFLCHQGHFRLTRTLWKTCMSCCLHVPRHNKQMPKPPVASYCELWRSVKNCGGLMGTTPFIIVWVNLLIERKKILLHV